MKAVPLFRLLSACWEGRRRERENAIKQMSPKAREEAWKFSDLLNKMEIARRFISIQVYGRSNKSHLKCKCKCKRGHGNINVQDQLDPYLILSCFVLLVDNWDKLFCTHAASHPHPGKISFMASPTCVFARTQRVAKHLRETEKVALRLLIFLVNAFKTKVK